MLLIAVGLYRSTSAKASLALTVADKHKFAAVLRLSRRGVDWYKFVDFTILHLHLATLFGVILLEFHRDFWHQKTRVPGLSYGSVNVV